MDTSELQQRLRALPPIEPNPLWKLLTKQRLLRLAGDRRLDWMPMTRWAVYTTQTEDTLPVFAANIRAAGNGWRPVVVEPRRLGSTVRAIQPSVVVIDASLAHVPGLLAEVKAVSRVKPLVLQPAELPQLTRKIA